MTTSLPMVLGVSAALFSIGLMAVLSRRHAIFILIGIEMMLTASAIYWGFSILLEMVQNHRDRVPHVLRPLLGGLSRRRL